MTPALVVPAVLLALNLGGPPPPRFSAGLTAGVAEVKGGAVARSMFGTYGLAASYRPLRLAALRLSYARMTETHDYTAFRFDTTYHRLTLAPEARLPMSNRLDLAVAVGPALTILHSSLDTSGGGGSRSGARWALWTGGAMLVRVWRLELRTDVGLTLLDRGPDLAAGLAVAYSIP